MFHYWFSVARVDLQRILGERLLVSSLRGKALRTLVESQSSPSDSTFVLKAMPGKLDIKRCEPCILFISLHGPLYKTRDFDVNINFHVIDDVIQKVQRHDDLINAHAMR